MSPFHSYKLISYVSSISWLTVLDKQTIRMFFYLNESCGIYLEVWELLWILLVQLHDSKLIISNFIHVTNLYVIQINQPIPVCLSFVNVYQAKRSVNNMSSKFCNSLLQWLFTVWIESHLNFCSTKEGATYMIF